MSNNLSLTARVNALETITKANAASLVRIERLLTSKTPTPVAPAKATPKATKATPAKATKERPAFVTRTAEERAAIAVGNKAAAQWMRDNGVKVTPETWAAVKGGERNVKALQTLAGGAVEPKAKAVVAAVVEPTKSAKRSAAAKVIAASRPRDEKGRLLPKQAAKPAAEALDPKVYAVAEILGVTYDEALARLA